jgi:hypothetical protein
MFIEPYILPTWIVFAQAPPLSPSNMRFRPLSFAGNTHSGCTHHTSNCIRSLFTAALHSRWAIGWACLIPLIPNHPLPPKIHRLLACTMGPSIYSSSCRSSRGLSARITTVIFGDSRPPEITIACEITAIIGTDTFRFSNVPSTRKDLDVILRMALGTWKRLG